MTGTWVYLRDENGEVIEENLPPDGSSYEFACQHPGGDVFKKMWYVDENDEDESGFAFASESHWDSDASDWSHDLRDSETGWIFAWYKTPPAPVKLNK